MLQHSFHGLSHQQLKGQLQAPVCGCSLFPEGCPAGTSWYKLGSVRLSFQAHLTCDIAVMWCLNNQGWPCSTTSADIQG